MKRPLPLLLMTLVWSQAPASVNGEDIEEPLSLSGAQQHALAHHPVLQASELQARASEEAVREARAAFFPQIALSATGVIAGDTTRIAASGGLNNPNVFQRESNGLLLNQLITDFGRTSNFTSSTRYQAEAANQTAHEVRGRILLNVNRAFFGVLEAKALLRVTEGTVTARSLLLERVSALAAAKLKSGLDVGFAEVGRSEARLLQLRAEARLEAARARLAEALGSRGHEPRTLVEEPLPPETPADVDGLVRSALANRPELLAVRAQAEGARKLASAEKAAQLPVINALGAVGFSPYRDDRLTATYGAAGLNVTLPVFNGGRLSARWHEAQLKADAATRMSDEASSQVERDVRLAWLDAQTAFKAIAVTQDLVESARRALELAESRYNLGISSIVEMSQAQLQETEAEIAQSSARYDYQAKRAALDFEIGALQ